MTQAIESRKDDLARVKVDTTFYSKPKFIWLMMINRVRCFDRALAIHNKFNSIMEDTLTEFPGHYILNISKQMSHANYFTESTLTNEGVTKYWLAVNKAIQNFNAHKMSLKPIKSTECQREQL